MVKGRWSRSMAIKSKARPGLAGQGSKVELCSSVWCADVTALRQVLYRLPCDVLPGYAKCSTGYHVTCYAFRLVACMLRPMGRLTTPIGRGYLHDSIVE